MKKTKLSLVDQAKQLQSNRKLKYGAFSEEEKALAVAYLKGEVRYSQAQAIFATNRNIKQGAGFYIAVATMTKQLVADGKLVFKK